MKKIEILVLKYCIFPKTLLKISRFIVTELQSMLRRVILLDPMACY